MQVAIGDDDASAETNGDVAVPKRQEVLQNLERLLRRQLTSFTPMKKNENRGWGIYDGKHLHEVERG